MTAIRQALPGREEWEHGPVMGTINAAGALLTAGAVGHLAELDPLWGAAGGGAGAVAALVAARGQEYTRTGLAYRAGCWLCAGGWLWRAWETSPWAQDSLAGLGVAAVAGGVLAPVLSRRERRERARRDVRLAVGARQARAAEWEDRIRRVARIRVRVVKVEAWPAVTVDGEDREPGYTLDVQLPRGGRTWRDLGSYCDGLAADAGLPHGCGVEPSPGINRGRALLRVGLVDTLGQDYPYPSDHPLSSCLDDWTLGRHRDGSPTLINTREASVLVVGSKGSGKTTLLHGMIGRYCEQVDQLVWVIDLNGGGLARPWLDAWLAGEADRPAIDWAAATVEEAIVVAQTALDIGRARKGEYAQLRMDSDSSLLPLSAELPQITLIIDEGKSIKGDQVSDPLRRQLSEVLRSALEECRNEGVNEVQSNLRPTGSALGGIDDRVQSDVLIMMRPKAEEIHKLFDAAGARAEDAPHKGSGLVSVDGGPPRPFKAPAFSPQQIRAASIAVAGRRPALDAPSARIAGERYTRRWDADRIGWLLPAAGGGDSPGEAAPAGAPTPGAGRLEAAGNDSAASMGATAARMDDIASRLRAEREADERCRAEEEAFAEIVARFGETPDPPPAADEEPKGGRTPSAAHDRRARALELLRRAGTTGLGAKALAEALAAALEADGDRTKATTRQTIQGWLRDEHREGRAWRRRGGVYVHGSHPRPDDAEDYTE